MMPTFEERFWAKIDKTDSCWLWTGSVNQHGYGRITYGHRNKRKSVVAHHIIVGRPLPGLEWDHKCRNPSCVNPDHLEMVTHQINVRRGNVPISNAMRLHPPRIMCKKGKHLWVPETIYVSPRGLHVCMQCRRESKGVINPMPRRAIRPVFSGKVASVGN